MDMEYLVDKKVKNKIDSEEVIIPDTLNEKIDSLLEGLPIKNKSKKYKKVAVAASILICSSLLATTIPIYAKDVPILSSLLNKFNIEKGYNNIIDKLGCSASSNGISVTINSVVYDGAQLLIDYTVNSNRALEEKPVIQVDNAILRVDNKRSNIATFKEVGEFLDGENKVYNGVTAFILYQNNFVDNNSTTYDYQTIMDNFEMNPLNIPEDFAVELNLKQLGGREGKIQGQWNFNLPISSSKVKENSREVVVNKDLSHVFKNTILEKIIITPIGLYLQSTEPENSYFGYILVDDKGKTIKDIGGEHRIDIQKNKARLIDRYETINEEVKTITCIPYTRNKSGKNQQRVAFNLKGETKIPLAPNKEITITKSEEKNGMTYVYYKANAPIYDYFPFYFIDEDENFIGRDKDKSKIGQNGEESIAVFNKPILSKKLQVICDTTIYYDEAFNVDIK